MDDTELVRRIRDGEPRAWSDLVHEYERLIYAIPTRMGLAQADVDEVFQNTWILLYEHIQHLRDSSKLRSWIATTARRESWRLQRRMRPDLGVEALELTDPHEGPSDELEKLELRDGVRLGVLALRPRCRKLLNQLFFGVDRPQYLEVARKLGVPVGSLGPTRARCLADLARYLEDHGFESSPEVDCRNGPGGT